MRAPQQHEECKDGCEARLTCTCEVCIDVPGIIQQTIFQRENVWG